MKSKVVRIVDRTNIIPEIMKVEVEWKCPTCDSTMGDNIRNHTFYEDGDLYQCDVWTNPCGHVAKYNKLNILSRV